MSISRGVAFFYYFVIYCATNHGIWCSEYFTPLDKIQKSPVYQARSLWNDLPVEMRMMHTMEGFKEKCRKKLEDEYIHKEMVRLAAGIHV